METKASNQLKQTENPLTIPPGWVWTKLGEILEPSDEKVDPLKSNELSYIGLEHIEKNTGKLLGYGNSSEVRSTKNSFRKGDLLYGKLRPYLNKVLVAGFEGVCSTDILVFRKSECLSSRFLQFRLMQEDFVRWANQQVSGVQHPRVDFKKISNFAVAHPPLPEQRRIVAKTEELFSKLDAGVESLKKVKAELKRYRQSVLKHAFEGKLTVEWRKQNADNGKPSASELLNHIKEERKKKLGKKYKELPPVDTSLLPALSEGWIWACVGDLCAVQGGFAFKSKAYKAGGIPLLRISNIVSKKVQFETDTVYLEQSYLKSFDDFKVSHGDILIALSGATTGKYGVYELDLPALLNQRVGRLRMWTDIQVLRRFIYLYLEVIRAQILKEAYGAAQPNISTTDLELFTIPLPDTTEQQAIVLEIDRCFSIADEVEKVIEQSLLQAVRLRQSILKRAFEGKLVPQDPSDEPAEKLLERIREKKEKQLQVNKVNRDNKREQNKTSKRGRISPKISV